MKKYLLTALIACISYLASAQRTQHALGFHIGGSTIDLEYQYHMSEKNFLDFTVGVFNLDDGFLAQGIYNWNIQQWSDWTLGRRGSRSRLRRPQAPRQQPDVRSCGNNRIRLHTESRATDFRTRLQAHGGNSPGTRLRPC